MEDGKDRGTVVPVMLASDFTPDPTLVALVESAADVLAVGVELYEALDRLTAAVAPYVAGMFTDQEDTHDGRFKAVGCDAAS